MSEVIVPIIMGSAADRRVADQIAAALDDLGVPSVQRIASAHKVPKRVMEILEQYEADPRTVVYITIAGRSNALSAFVDAQVVSPVIACPPYSDKFGGADLFSSLRMPSGVAPAVVLDPAGAALLAAKILAVNNARLASRVAAAQVAYRKRLIDADKALQQEKSR